ncbi:MAG TPA: homoserine dehydrogenase [Isosphaeraceae bacterium]|jgi:homoserine dehydrogenase|nr:homoserine dehydrogenase [Isosphaeraceae bacterium]
MERVGLGLLGLGTVGTGVARLLHDAADRLAARCGRRFEVRWAVVRDPARPRDVPIPADRIVADAGRALDDPEVAIVVELIGGIEPARSLTLAALDAGKDVVTANKALLAEHGAELFARARQRGRAVAFEASVAGGIPIVQALGVGLAANRVQSLAAIVNGTCNFILTKMTREGLPYAAALREAQDLGYAEADPTLDVDGTDTAHKLAILAQLAFGAGVTTARIPRVGIDRLQSADIRYAAELGYTVKLLAIARQVDAGLVLRVAPTLVRRGTPLADVSGPYNAIRVVGDAVGDTLFYGRGAGMMPTASAVVGDLIDVAVGRAALTARALDAWSASVPPVRLAPPAEVRSRYYLRFTIADRPGVLASLAHVLGLHGISIASVIQHDPGDDAPPSAPVPLVMMTHHAAEASILAAIQTVDRLDVVHAPSVCLGVQD